MRKYSPRLLAQFIKHGYQSSSISRRYPSRLSAKLGPLAFECNFEIVCGDNRECARRVELTAVADYQLDVSFEIVHRLVFPASQLGTHGSQVHRAFDLLEVATCYGQIGYLALSLYHSRWAPVPDGIHWSFENSSILHSLEIRQNPFASLHVKLLRDG